MIAMVARRHHECMIQLVRVSGLLLLVILLITKAIFQLAQAVS